MVFIEDREGVFDATIDKVWKLAQAHFTDGSKIHPRAKNLVTKYQMNKHLPMVRRKRLMDKL